VNVNVKILFRQEGRKKGRKEGRKEGRKKESA